VARPTRSRWKTRAIALLLGTCASLLGAELLLRAHNPMTLKLRGKEIVLPVNTRIVWRREGSNSRLDPSSVCTSNQLGFRGPDPPADFADHLTIVTVGGSTTACAFITDGKTWPELLAARLATSFDKVWLDNAGQDGHSTFTHQLLMEQVVFDLRPKLVIFLVGINDVGRLDLNDYDRTARPEHQGFADKVVAKSELLSTLQALYRKYRAFDVGVCGNWEVGLHDNARSTLSAAEEAKLLEEARGAPLAAYRTRLTRLVESTQAHGIEPVLVTQPSLYGDIVDPTTGVELGPLVHKDKPARLNWRILELYNDVTREVGRDHGLLVVDLAATLPKDSALYYDWIHYTNLGCERVAQILEGQLAPFLASKGHRAAIPRAR
jgi:lysophospholipase L1-like esterase